MKHLLIILFAIISFTVPGTVAAQHMKGISPSRQARVDSIKLLIEENKGLPENPAVDTVICDAYINWGEQLYRYDPDTALILWLIAHEMAVEKLAADQAPVFERKFLRSKADVTNNIGYIYKNQGDVKKGMEYYLESLKIYEDLSKMLDEATAYAGKKGVATTMNNLGGIYYEQGLHDKGMEYYKRSLEIRQEIGSKSGVAMSLNNIGALYKEEGDLATALDYYQRSLKVYEELERKSGIALTLNNIGHIYYVEGSHDYGLDYFLRSLKIRQEIGGKSAVSLSFHNVATVYDKQGNMEKAMEYANKGMDLARDLGFPARIRTSAKFLSQMNKKAGNYKKSLEMYKLYIKMRDSINNEATQKAAIRQQTKYAYEKKHLADSLESAKEFEIKDLEISEQKALLKQSRTQQIALTGGGILFLVLAIVAFMSYRTKRRDNEVISAQKEEVEKKKEEAEHQKELVEEKNKEITDSINYAKRIQDAILPPDDMVTQYLPESFVLYKPKDIVAGDFYWMNVFDDNIIFAAADCTGHGVPGAMLSMLCNNALNRSVREYGLKEPGEILDKARELVIAEFEKSGEDIKDGMDISLCSLQGNKLKFAGAYNPMWLVRNGEVLETKGDKQPIGVFDNVIKYTTHTIDLEKGDTFYIFSDGYVDQFGGPKVKKFKAKAFRELLITINKKPMIEQKVLLEQTFENWRGDLEQIDDVCVIGVKI